jgi:hypothetical protein
MSGESTRKTWADSRALIQGLWPNAAMTKELAGLFEDRLSNLDHSLLATAIGNHRIESKFPSPDIGEILSAYHKAKRLDSSAWKSRERDPPLPPSPEVDVAVESRTAKQIDVLSQEVNRSIEDVEDLIERVLDAMDENQIGPPTANRKLVPLQVLRMRLEGKTVHPSALTKAESVWPDIEKVKPDAEGLRAARERRAAAAIENASLERGDAWEG